MNPRGFIFGLGLAAALIAAAFVVRSNYSDILALINPAAQAAATALSR